jgi:toxin HigB-1
MIVSFRDAETEKFFSIGKSRRIPSTIQRTAMKKLYILHAAQALEQLTVPPGNKLEVLYGDRAGQHSIRINDQYRVCFVWGKDNNAREVEIVDYHRNR